jgi:hypothetical protein
MRSNLNRLLSAAALLLLSLAAAAALGSCGAAKSLGNAFNIETNPYKAEIPMDTLATSSLNGKWTINVSNVVLDDPQGALGFTAQQFADEVNGQSFYFDAGALANYNYPFNIAIDESHLMRLDIYEYRLDAMGTVTLQTDAGDRVFHAELDINGAVDPSYSTWQGDGSLTYRELETGDLTGGISLNFLLSKN